MTSDAARTVGPVVLAAQHLLELRALDEGLELRQGALEVGRHVLPRLLPLEQHARVVLLPLELREELQVGLDPLPALEDLLGGLLVAPEVLRRHPLVVTSELGPELVLLKDSRGCPRPSLRGLRTSS